MIIQNNIMAMNSFRQLAGNNNALGRNLEKLSSGFRINRAGDDAAGLAISEKMRAQIRGLETAQRNAQDGISLIQTAEGALTEVHAMLNRMVELATQAANGIYDNHIDRAALDNEFQALKEEIDRISQATNFNGLQLLDGSLSAVPGVGGTRINGGQIINFQNAALQGADLGSAAAGGAGIDMMATNTIRIDGHDVLINWNNVLSPEQQMQLLTAAGNLNTAANRNVIANVLTAGINSAIAASGAPVANVTVTAESLGDGTTGRLTITSGIANGNSEITLVGAGANLGDTVLGRFISADMIDPAVIDTVAGAPTANAAGTNQARFQAAGLTIGVNDSFQMNLGGQVVHVNFAAAITDTMTMQDVATALQNAIHTAMIRANEDIHGAPSMTAINPGPSPTESTIQVTVGANGGFQFQNTTGRELSFANNPGNVVADRLGLTNVRGFTPSAGGLNLQVGDTADHFNIITVSVDDMSTVGLGLVGMNIRSYEAAVNAVGELAQQGDPGTIRGAINTVSSQRAVLGALQNRLEHTINNLGVTTENLQAAESRIRDTDMAREMMGFTKNNILIQASQAMLAQANQVPQGVLQLIR